MLPTWCAGKFFIEEMTKLLKTWVDNPAIKDIAIKSQHDNAKPSSLKAIEKL